MTSAAAQAQAQPQSTYLALVAAISLLPWMMLVPVVRPSRQKRDACGRSYYGCDWVEWL